MKLRHLPPVLFLFVTALSFPSLSVHRHLSLPRPRSPPPPSSSHHAAVGDDDALLRRLASVDPGADYLLAEATALLANATLSSTRSPGDAAAQHHHRLLTLRFPSHDSTNATAYRLRVPHDSTLHADDDGAALLAAFRASLRSLLLTRRHIPHDAAAVMRDLPYLLGLRHRRFPTCAVVGNSGILLGSGRGAQIDAHDFIIRLNNAPAGGGFTRDVGARTSLSLAHSTVLRRCATSAASAATTTPRCAACHPYGRDVPLAMYVSHAAHLLDALVCGNATSPFRLVVTDPRLDALCARIAKYYSLRRFVSGTGEPASTWRRDERPPHFHYSSGLQAVVVALGVCEEVSMFGFGKAAGVKPHHYHTGRKKETAVHDYEAEYQFYRDLQTRPEAVPFLDQAVAAGFRLPPVRQYW